MHWTTKLLIWILLGALGWAALIAVGIALLRVAA